MSKYIERKTEYMVVPLVGQPLLEVLSTARLIKNNTEFLIARYPNTPFYRDILNDCDVILKNAQAVAEGYEGLIVTREMLKHLVKRAPENKLFKLAVTEKDYKAGKSNKTDDDLPF
jgi:hypothetical protein